MAETQDQSTVANMLNPLANGLPANVDSDLESKKAMTPEQRYIEFLEDKVARLLREAKHDKADDINVVSEVTTKHGVTNRSAENVRDKYAESMKDATGGSVKDTAAESVKDKRSEEKDTGEGARKSRVRYIERKLNKFGEFEDTDVDDFGEVEEKIASAYVADGGKSEEEKDDEYAIAWRRSLPGTASGRGTRELLIESTALRKALKEVTQGYSRLSFDTAEVSFSSPYEVIYDNTEKLKEYAMKADEKTKTDIDILLREVGLELATKRKDITRLAQNGQVTYELLWTLFYPGCLVCHEVMGEMQISIVGPGSLGHLDSHYDLDLWSIDYDGTDFIYSEINVLIESFKGPKAFTDLEVYPLEKWTGPEDCDTPKKLRQKLIQRGEAFEKLCTANIVNKYRSYDGPALIEGEVEMVTDSGGDGENRSATMSLAGKMRPVGQNGSEKLDPRSSVMVDHYAYLIYGKMPRKLGRHETKTPCNCKPCVTLRNMCFGELPSSPKEEWQKYARPPTLTETQRLVCPPRILGFDVRQKLWVQLLVDLVKEIGQKDQDEAFKKLVLPGKTKELLKTLVTEHAKNSSPLDDLIPGKGNGLIVLLHGPPGVGKTLTAESLAMLSGKPLYSVTISDIGTSPAVVEQNLVRVFELATHWNAILLFDEADVFLESRSLKDLRRNSLVSTLLRILEYFSGILFLTSNRVKTFDEAFQSRIHLAIRYHELDESQRRSIWELWLDKAGEDIEDRRIFDAELEKGGDLVTVPLNGRQIRNCFRSGMALAKARPVGQRKVRYEDVDKMVKRTGELLHYMMQSEAMASLKRER